MNDNLDDLKHIRSIMERSTKFLSLSGISGVSAGVFALLGSLVAYLDINGVVAFTDSIVIDFIIIASCVFILACTSAFYFSLRKARKNNSKFWMPATRQVLKDFAVPLVSGGLFCLLLIYHEVGELIGSATLIFYGLALISAGARTYRDIKILGACQIILGVLAGCFIGYGLYFWAFGFGILHIVYGIVMYFKYDRDRN